MTALRARNLHLAAANTEPNPAVSDEALRILEALLFAAPEPLDEKMLAARVPADTDLKQALATLAEHYAERGVQPVRVAGKWALRTAPDLRHFLALPTPDPKKLSRAGIETLAIVAYHQPVTRAEIEEIRGVTISKGTLDILIEVGWVRLRGRRKVPGRPVTYGTTEAFLVHFGLDSIDDLPGLEELRGAGFFDGRLPPEFSMPMPSDDPSLRDDEDPLGDEPLDLLLSPEPEAEEGPASAPPEKGE